MYHPLDWENSNYEMDFYCMEMSAPCRSVMLTAKAVGVTFNKKHFDLMKGEHMHPKFIDINPQHCVPTIVDGDFVLWESRPICTYLASQYGKCDSLYPKDLKTRAQIDKMLYFDMGTLYHRFANYVYPTIFGGQKIDPTKLEPLNEALGWLDGFLRGQDFSVGNGITVADFSLIATVSSIVEAGIDCSKYADVLAWVERCKTQMIGYDTENDVGAKQFGTMVKSKMN